MLTAICLIILAWAAELPLWASITITVIASVCCFNRLIDIGYRMGK